MEHKGVIVVDFGGHSNQLIARRIREANVFCELLPYTKCMDKAAASKPKGVVFASGSEGIYEKEAPALEKQLTEMGIPVLNYSAEDAGEPNPKLDDFLYKICGCAATWTMANFAKDKIEEIKKTVGDKKVLCALSGGVDSSVSAVLVHKAIGDNLTCVFVDHGLLRKDEAKQVMEVYGEQFHMRIKHVNARDRFLNKLVGVTDPEEKRKIIGAEFINVFEDETEKIRSEVGEISFLLQGTIYPDVVESGIGSALVKSHHNVGGLPENMKLALLEPLRFLFKDEVRKVGEELGIAGKLVWRQPFPGPGIGVRCLGEITEEKLEIIRESDAILREEIANAGLDRAIWQYFTVLPNIQSVGVRDGIRNYEHMVGIRAITSVDAMTSDWARIPYDVLEKISRRIVNEVKGVNRVVYDITTKPPSTIEWE